MRNKYLPGEKYHRWLIIAEDGFNTHGQRLVICRCECGNERSIRAASLKSASRSCGCLNKETITKHGLEGTPEYSSWNQMVNRCCNPKNSAYHEYGALGISVHDEWVNNPQKFIDYIGPRPSLRHSIDRIDSTKGYEPGNVKWSDKSEQCFNRRKKKNATSKYRGICFNKKSGKWIARLNTRKGIIYLGIYSSEDEAYAVYVREYIKEHGHRPPYE